MGAEQNLRIFREKEGHFGACVWPFDCCWVGGFKESEILSKRQAGLISWQSEENKNYIYIYVNTYKQMYLASKEIQHSECLDDSVDLRFLYSVSHLGAGAGSENSAH